MVEALERLSFGMLFCEEEAAGLSMTVFSRGDLDQEPPRRKRWLSEAGQGGEVSRGVHVR